MIADTVIAALIGGGVAAIISSVFTLWNLKEGRLADERKQIRELAVRVATEEWKITYDHSQKLNLETYPLQAFLMHSMHTVIALDGRLTTEQAIRDHIRKGFSITDAAIKEIDDHRKIPYTPV